MALVNNMSVQCCEVAFGSERYHEMVRLRDAVLRRPLGLVFTPDELMATETYVHLAATVNNEVIATVLISFEDEITARFRQVAVADHAQGTGVGRTLMEYAHKDAKVRGALKGVVYARDMAVPFYARLGYAPEGEPFVQSGIEHRIMRMKF